MNKRHFLFPVVIAILLVLCIEISGQNQYAVLAATYPTGTIEGKVTTVKGDPITNVHIYAVDKSCGNSTTGARATTDASGRYSVTGLPAGSYYVFTEAVLGEATPSAYYINEFWDEGSGTLACRDAVAVNVGDGQTVYSIDFSLDEGARVTGRITTAGGAPLQDICVYAHGNTCSGGYWLRAQATTDAQGDYSITGIPAGTCYITADASCRGSVTNNYYVKGFWDGGSGTSICGNAAPITLQQGETVSGISFSLEEGGKISGQVTAETGEKFSNVCIRVNNEKCMQGDWFGEGLATDTNGNYSVVVPEGSYYVYTDLSCTEAIPGGTYRNEYWDGDQGTIDCNKAAPVNVIAKQAVGSIDFSLQEYTGTTTTTTADVAPPPAECELDSDCNDGLFCTGVETCQSGVCMSSGSPCASDELCIEDAEECRTFEKRSVPAVMKKVYRPTLRYRACTWVMFIDETGDSTFNSFTSSIIISGAGASYSGVDFDISRIPLKIGFLIMVPVCVAQDATPGPWTVQIQTDVNTGDALILNIIEGSFEVI